MSAPAPRGGAHPDPDGSSPVRAGWRERPVARVLGAAAAAAVLAASAAMKVGEDVFEHESGTFDAAVAHWMLAHRSPLGTAVFLWITRLGSPPVVALVTLAVGGWLWVRRGHRLAGVVVATPVIAVAAFSTIKLALGRARPVGGAVIPLSTYAFPSGHATTAAAVLGSLGYVLARERPSGSARIAAVAGTAIVLIGVSRVYLGEHWATDVLGGWAIGALIAAFAVGSYEWLRRSGATPSGS